MSFGARKKLNLTFATLDKYFEVSSEKERVA